MGGRGGAAVPALRGSLERRQLRPHGVPGQPAHRPRRLRRGAAGAGLAAAPAALDPRSRRRADAADGRLLGPVGAARRLCHPAAQRPGGDWRDGLLQPGGPSGQRRSPLDAERSRRTDWPVHGAQAGRAWVARQRGALPVGHRRARRGDHPHRRRGERAGHQRQLRTDPGALVGRDGLAPVGGDLCRGGRRRGAAGPGRRAPFPGHPADRRGAPERGAGRDPRRRREGLGLDELPAAGPARRRRPLRGDGLVRRHHRAQGSGGARCGRSCRSWR